MPDPYPVLNPIPSAVSLDGQYHAVKSATQTAPPGSPADLDMYAVPLTGASGAWSAKGGWLVFWDDEAGVWQGRDLCSADGQEIFIVVAEDESGRLYYAAAGGWTQYHAPASAAVNAQTGTSYTLQASDNGKVITCNNASAITVTVPSGLGAGFNCAVIQKGAGQVTFSPSGVTVNNRQGHTKTAGQKAVVGLVADVANNFYLGGDTAA
jgi:hypothetical protein